MLQSVGWLRIQATSLSVWAGSVSHCTEGPLVADVAAPVAGDKAITFPATFPPHFLLAVVSICPLDGAAEGP